MLALYIVKFALALYNDSPHNDGTPSFVERLHISGNREILNSVYLYLLRLCLFALEPRGGLKPLGSFEVMSTDINSMSVAALKILCTS